MLMLPFVVLVPFCRLNTIFHSSARPPLGTAGDFSVSIAEIGSSCYAKVQMSTPGGAGGVKGGDFTERVLNEFECRVRDLCARRRLLATNFG
uniref:Secreted peptide n=1 Tax=Anopheles braziliensis TaxID=58242 RepID=A0A2M3ZLE5_9DIPT